MNRWIWAAVALFFLLIGVFSFSREDVGEGVIVYNIGPLHFSYRSHEVVLPTEGTVPPVRRLDIAGVQPGRTELLLSFIFRNRESALMLTQVLMACVILITLFSFLGESAPEGEGGAGVAAPQRRRPPIRPKVFRILSITLASVLGVVLLFFLWSDSRIAAGEAVVAPPESACIPKRDNAKAAVILIHGWNGDNNSWLKFPKLLCQDEDLLEMEIFLVNYPTYMASSQFNIHQLSRWLTQKFFSGTIRNFQELHIIAHSMGGLVARTIYLNDTKTASRILSIVSIASPYEGAGLAQLAQALGITGIRISNDYTKDLAPNSDFVNELADRWTDQDPKPMTYCFASKMDEVVSVLSATRQCDCTSKYPQWGHIEMVKPESSTDDRYVMPVRALKNVIAAHKLAPSMNRPACW